MEKPWETTHYSVHQIDQEQLYPPIVKHMQLLQQPSTTKMKPSSLQLGALEHMAQPPLK